MEKSFWAKIFKQNRAIKILLVLVEPKFDDLIKFYPINVSWLSL